MNVTGQFHVKSKLALLDINLTNWSKKVIIKGTFNIYAIGQRIFNGFCQVSSSVLVERATLANIQAIVSLMICNTFIHYECKSKHLYILTVIKSVIIIAKHIDE